MRTILCLCLLAVLCCSGAALADETQSRPVRVAFHPSAPCVVVNDAGVSGFDVELWQAMMDVLGWQWEYTIVPQFTDLLAQAQAGSVDAAMSGITITAGRERQMDFSHSYLSTGLRIMIRADQQSSGGFHVKLMRVATAVGRTFASPAVVIFGIVILLAAHGFWLLERGSPTVSTKYWPGVYQAFYFTIVTFATVGFGDISPQRHRGRLMTIAMILVGISFFSVFSGSLAAELVVDKMDTTIKGPEDLRGKTVATKVGTTSVDVLQRYGAKVVTAEDMAAVYQHLTDKTADAVVFDEPDLRYYAQTAGAGQSVLVGSVFERQDYSVALPQNSPLREDLNRALLKIKENGVYDRIYKQWFGNE